MQHFMMFAHQNEWLENPETQTTFQPQIKVMSHDQYTTKRHGIGKL